MVYEDRQQVIDAINQRMDKICVLLNYADLNIEQVLAKYVAETSDYLDCDKCPIKQICIDHPDSDCYENWLCFLTGGPIE